MSEPLLDALDFAAFSLARTMSAVLQQDSYLYWPYLLSSIVIALAAWLWLGASSGPRVPWREFWSGNFSAALWWHRSARADYWLYIANGVVVSALFAWLLVDERKLAAWIGSALGLAETSAAAGETGGLTRVLFTIAFFVAYDFGRFVAHCLLHDVPALWEFHKVHHSAEVLTPVTSFRAHPVELLLMAWGAVTTTALVLLAFNTLVPGKVGYYSFLGLHVLLFASNLIGNLRHSPVWLTYGPAWGRWLISPAHHQLHHSCEPRHLGCNRGFELAVWDRLYGTLIVPHGRPESFRLGLGDGTEAQYHRLTAMYLLPFRGAAREIGALARRSLNRLSLRSTSQ